MINFFLLVVFSAASCYSIIYIREIGDSNLKYAMLNSVANWVKQDISIKLKDLEEHYTSMTLTKKLYNDIFVHKDQEFIIYLSVDKTNTSEILFSTLFLFNTFSDFSDFILSNGSIKSYDKKIRIDNEPKGSKSITLIKWERIKTVLKEKIMLTTFLKK